MTASERAVSEEGLDLIREFEGLSLTAYLCPGGHLTIGYGHVLLPEDAAVFGLGRQEMAKAIQSNSGSLRVDTAQADAFLRADAAVAADYLNAEPYVEALAQNQFDALASFIFNVGKGNFSASTLRRKLLAGLHTEAAVQFDRWVHTTVGGKKRRLAGLVRRRAAERALFERPAAAAQTAAIGQDTRPPSPPAALSLEGGKPWWQSRTILAAIVAMLPAVAGVAGLDWSRVAPHADDITTIIAAVLAIIARKTATTVVK